MKLRDVAKGTWAIKPITFRLANAVEAVQPGQPASDAPVFATAGVRLLTGRETADVYEKAAELAKSRGVEKWDPAHPQCLLMEKACAIARAYVDIESDIRNPDPFFASVDEVLDDPRIGPDNIVFLHERYEWWQDECSFEKKTMTGEEVIATALAHAEAPESSEGPLGRMRPGLRESYTRTLAVLLSTLLTPRSPSGAPTATSSQSSKSESAEPPPASPETSDPSTGE